MDDINININWTALVVNSSAINLLYNQVYNVYLLLGLSKGIPYN